MAVATPAMWSEPALAAVVVALAREMCTHSAAWERPCRGCATVLLRIVELIRGSAFWELSDGSFNGQVAMAQDLLMAGGVTRMPVPVLADSYDGEEWPDRYLRAQLTGRLVLTVDEVEGIVDLALAWSTAFWEELRQLDGEVRRPPRRGAQRAELEIAARLGWRQPQRWELEERVRVAADGALNEAHFIRLCHHDGIELIPKLGAPHRDVVGYSAYLQQVPDAHRREFSGGSLAQDLSLPALQDRWRERDAGSAQGSAAWASWLSLCPSGSLPMEDPPERGDGRWRWVLPQLVGDSDQPLGHGWPDRRSYRQVFEYLSERQANVCAMCQIRRHASEATRGEPVPAALLGRPQHMDHDHETGLVRGLLCLACNTIREPSEKASGGDVRRAYIAHPPAEGLTIPWRPS